jgi:ATP-binding cassette subfamily B (MDR/TAP) protein 1
VVSFIRSALLTLVASATLPVILISYGIAVPFVFKNYKAAEKHKEQASSLAFEIFESIRIVAAFGAEQKLADQHQKMMENSKKHDRKNGPLVGKLKLSFDPFPPTENSCATDAIRVLESSKVSRE